jgi:hypothetical protein
MEDLMTAQIVAAVAQCMVLVMPCLLTFTEIPPKELTMPGLAGQY